jgi:hypothetical protein
MMTQSLQARIHPLSIAFASPPHNDFKLAGQRGVVLRTGAGAKQGSVPGPAESSLLTKMSPTQSDNLLRQSHTLMDRTLLPHFCPISPAASDPGGVA